MGEACILCRFAAITSKVMDFKEGFRKVCRDEVSTAQYTPNAGN
jgi:hypothetical protein